MGVTAFLPPFSVFKEAGDREGDGDCVGEGNEEGDGDGGGDEDEEEKPVWH